MEEFGFKEGYPLPLTPRETEVAEPIILGKSNKYIQEKLAITSHTIKAHISSLYYKYGLTSKIRGEYTVKRLQFNLLYRQSKYINKLKMFCFA